MSDLKKTSDARLRANRDNAKKSTGPRTAEGKHRSSQNALKHGLTATDITPRGEDLDAFPAVLESLLESFNPSSAAEASLIKRMAGLQVRLDRCARMETGLIDLDMPDITPDATQEEINCAMARSFTYRDADFNNLSRYEANLSRAYDRAFKQLLTLRKEQLDPGPEPAPQPGPQLVPSPVPDETNPIAVDNNEPAAPTRNRRPGKRLRLPKPKPQEVTLVWEWADGRDAPHPLNNLPPCRND